MKKKQLTLHVRISEANNVVWEGEATSVSSKNSSGIFDVLPMHANFLTCIKKEPIVVKLPDNKENTYAYDYAVLHVEGDTVRIYSEMK